MYTAAMTDTSKPGDAVADALRDTAMGLAMYDERVDAAADVINRGVARDLHLAGLRVDPQERDRAIQPG